MNGRIARAILAITATVVLIPLAEAEGPSGPPTVDLQASATRSAANDLAQAVLFVEMSDARADVLARKVNEVIATALKQAGQYKTVHTRSGASNTYPVYSREGRRIESWRMRSELQLESEDIAALTTLIGALQSTLSLGSIQFVPRQETRAAAEDAAAIDAIAAFQTRASLVARTLGKSYRIRHLSIGGAGLFVPESKVMMRMSAAAEPMPAQAGQSNIQVDVSGTIELLEGSSQ